MKKPVRYILGGILALLGFSSCTALREARQDSYNGLSPKQQQTVNEIVAEMDAKYQDLQNDREAREAARRQHVLDSIRRAEIERNVLLYAVPNVPYQQIKEK